MGVKHVVSITGECTYGLVFRTYVDALLCPTIDTVYVDAHDVSGNKWSLDRLHEQAMRAIRDSLVYEIEMMADPDLEHYDTRKEDLRVGKIEGSHRTGEVCEYVITSSKYHVDHVVDSSYSCGHLDEDSCVTEAKKSLAQARAKLSIRSKLVSPNMKSGERRVEK